MNRLPEILAPAGSPEALRAAVRCGADAVYLGASAFNARQGAHNFDTAALREGEAAHSLRDLSLQAYGADLAALGVDSLKIEGRLKRPEYVAAAVSVYRAAVRGEAPAPGHSGD